MFSITQLIESLTTGVTDVITLTPDAPLTETKTIRWVIVPTGELPIASDAFPALSGVLDFDTSSTQPQTLSLTPNEINHGFGRDFEIRFYEVVGNRDDDSTESDDVLLDTFAFEIAGDETITYPEEPRSGGNDKNVITLGTTWGVEADGLDEDDSIIITKYQYGDVTIRDQFGSNLIKFDAGVEITGFQEISAFGGNVVRTVVLTLSTGAEITINTPKAASISFQLGDGNGLSYDEFKTAIFSSDDDDFVTNTEITFTNSVVIDTPTTAPVLSETPTESRSVPLSGQGNDDILEAGSEYDLEMDALDGNDVFIVTRFQYGDVTISDQFGSNLIKFDAGVEITGFQEISAFGGNVVRTVVLTLSTGAEITINTPKAASNTFQLGDGDIITDYDTFKTVLFASDDDGFVTNTEITFTNPIVIEGAGTSKPPVFDVDTYAVEITEDITEGTEIITVSASADPNVTLSYSIIGGNENNLFAINSVTGNITLASGKTLDFESAGAHELTIEVTDGKDKASATVSITVTDVNEAPVITAAGTGSVAENAAGVDTGITFTVADQDAGDSTFSWDITGTGSDKFEVATDGSGGYKLKLKDGVSLDYEETSSYSLTITATDDGTPAQTSASIPVTVAVTDVNEAPVITVAGSGSVVENMAGFNTGITLTVTDADTGDSTFSWDITGTGSGNFEIVSDGSGGYKLKLKDEVSLNFADASSYTLTISATDNGVPSKTSDEVTVEVLVRDLITGTVTENAEGSDTGVSLISKDATTWTITGDQADKFAVVADGDDWKLVLKDGVSLDFEEASTISLTVDDDVNNMPAVQVEITVTNVFALTDMAAFTGDVTGSVDAGADDTTSAITATGTLAQASGLPSSGVISIANSVFSDRFTTDVTATGDEIANTDAGGSSQSLIVGAGTYGTLSLFKGFGGSSVSWTWTYTLDKDRPATLELADGEEVTETFTIYYATEDGYYQPADITITISGSDDGFAFSQSDGYGFGVDEDASVIGSVLARNWEADTPGVVSYAITSGDEDGLFDIDANGDITVAAGKTLDFETAESHSLTITATDSNGDTATTTVTVTVTDVNDAPVFSSTDNTYIARIPENLQAGDPVATIRATDADAGDVVTFSITEGNDDGLFVIDTATGDITLAAGKSLDFESANAYTLKVEASDGTISAIATVNIRVTDANDAPVITALGTGSVAENAAGVDTGITFTVADPDAGDSTFSWDITGPGSDKFEVAPDGSGGYKLKLRDGVSLDYEDTASYLLTITAMDGGTPAQTSGGIEVTVTVIDVNEAPVFDAASYSVNINEGVVAGTEVAAVSATSDAGETLTYSITSGNDDNLFVIDSTTGTITLADGKALDHETAPSHTLTVEVSDGINAVNTQVAITVDNVDVAPVLRISPLNAIVDEGVAGADTGITYSFTLEPGTTLGSVRLTGRDSRYFELVPTGANSGKIKLKDGVSFNVGDYYTLRVSVVDSEGNANVPHRLITVEVNDVADFAFADSSEAKVGSALTIEKTADDADGNSGGFSYQWFRIDMAGTRTDISSATSTSYTLTLDDVNNTLGVTITYTDDNGRSHVVDKTFSNVDNVFELADDSPSGAELDIATDGSTQSYSLGIAFKLDVDVSQTVSFKVQVDGVTSQDFAVEKVSDIWTLVYKGDGFADSVLAGNPHLSLIVTASVGPNEQTAVDIDLSEKIIVTLHDGQYVKWGKNGEGNYGFYVYDASNDQVISKEADLNDQGFTYSNIMYLDDTWSTDPTNTDSSPPSSLTLGAGYDIYVIGDDIGEDVSIVDTVSASGLKNLIRFEEGVEIVAKTDETNPFSTVATNLLVLDTDGDKDTTDDQVELKVIGETFDFQIGYGNIMSFDELIGHFLPEV